MTMTATATKAIAARVAARAAAAQVVARRTRAMRALYQTLADLVNFDVDSAQPGDWLRFRIALDELQHAASADPRAPLGANLGNPQRLGDLEAEVRALLPDLQRLVRESVALGGSLVPITVEVGAMPGRMLATGSTRDIAVLMAVHLLTYPARPPLGICPEDDRVFVRYRGQRFCSHRCVAGANTRAYRARLAAGEPPLTKHRRRRRRRAPSTDAPTTSAPTET
jgi:hypothetical protein